MSLSPTNLFSILFFLIAIVRPIQAVHYNVRTMRSPNGRLLTEIGRLNAYLTLTSANAFVLETLNLEPGNRKDYDQVTLTIESFTESGVGGYNLQVASTNGNEIRVNTDYLESVNGDMVSEFKGIVFHESTQVWQWDGHNAAPKGLVSGIADYVRLTAGWPSRGWPLRGSGSRWDEGYAVTAYFLEYCNGLRDGFVAELNAKMRSYYGDHFFLQLLGKTVDELWVDYNSAYKFDIRLTTIQQPETMTGERNIAKSDRDGLQLKFDAMEMTRQEGRNLEKLSRMEAATASFQSVPILEEDGRRSIPSHFPQYGNGFKDCFVSYLNSMLEKTVHQYRLRHVLRKLGLSHGSRE